jgi:hypothetical protein
MRGRDEVRSTHRGDLVWKGVFDLPAPGENPAIAALSDNIEQQNLLSKPRVAFVTVLS